MNLRVERLSIEQYDRMIALWKEAHLAFKPGGRESRSMMAMELARPHCAAFGLFSDDRLVGVTLANYDGRKGWVNRLAVHPDVRGIGLAARLITAAELFLHDCGARVIAVLIDDENLPSQSAFQKEGYELLEHIRYFAKHDSSES